MNDLIGAAEIRNLLTNSHLALESRVSLVHITQLKDSIESASHLNRTILVYYNDHFYISCLFVCVSETQKSVFILNYSCELEKTHLKNELARLSLVHCTIYSLDSRLKNYGLHGAIAIEDSERLFYEPRVPHLPDSREEDWGTLPVEIVKHEPYSRLLLYSECLSRYEMKLMLGQDSPYIWLTDGEHKSCLLSTYNWLHKIKFMEDIFRITLA